MAREMTDEEKQEYDQLTANMEQMKLRLEELTAGPTVYGYARVSTYNQAAHGNSLEEQKRQLKAAGAEEVYADIFTGKQLDRPELQKLIDRLNKGDTLIVTKLDRLGRSVSQASALITRRIACLSKSIKVVEPVRTVTVVPVSSMLVTVPRMPAVVMTLSPFLSALRISSIFFLSLLCGRMKNSHITPKTSTIIRMGLPRRPPGCCSACSAASWANAAIEERVTMSAESFMFCLVLR